MAALAFKALSIGAEKVPDKAFHAIPYFRPEGEENPLKLRKKKDKKSADERMHSEDQEPRRKHRHHRSSRERRKSDDYSASDESGDEEPAPRQERPTRRNRRYTSSRHLDRGYDSDGGRDGYHQQAPAPMPMPVPANGNGQYFPPPPQYAYEDANGQAQPEMSRGDINNAGNPYASPPPSQYQPSPDYQNRRTSFNPTYTPHADYATNYSQQPHPSQYQGALAVQPPSTDDLSREAGYSTSLAPYNMPPPPTDPSLNGSTYPTYYPPQDNYDAARDRSMSRDRSRPRRYRPSDEDDYSGRSRSRSRSRHRSRDRRSKSRSGKSKDGGRSRSRAMKDQAKNVMKNNRDVASSALGVLAGGLVGNQMGRGNKIGTLAGAVLGGFGANLLEKQHADRKKSRRDSEHHHHGRRRRDDDDYGYEYGGGRDDDDDRDALRRSIRQVLLHEQKRDSSRRNSNTTARQISDRRSDRGRRGTDDRGRRERRRDSPSRNRERSRRRSSSRKRDTKRSTQYMEQSGRDRSSSRDRRRLRDDRVQHLKETLRTRIASTIPKKSSPLSTRASSRTRRPYTLSRASTSPILVSTASSVASQAETPSHVDEGAHSPHVHFGRVDTREFMRTATAQSVLGDMTSRSEKAAHSAPSKLEPLRRDTFAQTSLKKDMSTQTSRPTTPTSRQVSPRRFFSPKLRAAAEKKDRRKQYLKQTLEKDFGREPADKMVRTAETIKKAARKGTWDGTCVEEVFMEMTGVKIGQKDYMRSKWC